jgi:hypothetical protein
MIWRCRPSSIECEMYMMVSIQEVRECVNSTFPHVCCGRVRHVQTALTRERALTLDGGMDHDDETMAIRRSQCITCWTNRRVSVATGRHTNSSLHLSSWSEDWQPIWWGDVLARWGRLNCTAATPNQSVSFESTNIVWRLYGKAFTNLT